MRPRLLIPLSLQFSVRYVLRTGLLARLVQHAHPIVLLAWEDAHLSRELIDAGAEVHGLPQSQRGCHYSRVRRVLNCRFERRLASPTTKLIRKHQSVVRSANSSNSLRRWSAAKGIEGLSWIPGMENLLLQEEKKALRSDTNFETVRCTLRTLKADAVLSITPYLPDEEMAVRACVEDGMRSCAAILSFDNITTRPRMSSIFDAYLLWNRYNQNELHRGYPAAGRSTTTIVGPPQFDFYWDESCFWTDQQWRREVGLPEGRPVLLFGGGFHGITPHEPMWLSHLDQAIESGEIRNKPVVLFRRHPVDPEDRWLPVLKQCKHVVANAPWPTPGKLGHADVSRYSIEKLASTLLHSAAHVNCASTLTVDGAILDRPQIGPAYDDRPGRPFDDLTRAIYRREHFVPITQSGGLELATSREGLVAAVNSALEDPGRLAEGRRQIVREICTFTDGKCTDRAAAAIASFLGC